MNNKIISSGYYCHNCNKIKEDVVFITYVISWKSLMICFDCLKDIKIKSIKDEISKV